MTIEIADRLCAYRKHFGYSQEQLAEKIGVSRQAVSKWERAEASPDTDNLILLSEIYGVTLDDLLNTDPVRKSENTVQADDVSEDKVSFNKDIHEEENGHVHTDKDGNIAFEANESPFLKQWNRFPWALLCCAAYLIMGFCDILGGWGRGWMVFLTIPLYHSLGHAVAEHNPRHFYYPVLILLIYLFLGFWHYSWVLFLTIPLYYAFCGFFTNTDDYL